MKVQELIEELQHLNPTLPVKIYKGGCAYDFIVDSELVIVFLDVIERQ